MNQRNVFKVIVAFFVSLFLSILMLVFVTPIESKAETYPNVKFMPPNIDIYINNVKSNIPWTYENGGIIYDYDNDLESVIGSIDFIRVGMSQPQATNQRFTYLEIGYYSTYFRINLNDLYGTTYSDISIERQSYGQYDRNAIYEIDYSIKNLQGNLETCYFYVSLPVDSHIRLVDNNNTSLEYNQGFIDGSNQFNERDYDLGFKDAFYYLHENGFNGFSWATSFTDSNSFSYGVGFNNASAIDFDFNDLLQYVFLPFELLTKEIALGITFGHLAIIPIVFGLIGFLFSLKKGKK